MCARDENNDPVGEYVAFADFKGFAASVIKVSRPGYRLREFRTENVRATRGGEKKNYRLMAIHYGGYGGERRRRERGLLINLAYVYIPIYI